MLELRRVSKRFSGIPAVDDVSFCARPGEVTGYLGPNGSGKSTTMKMITGLIEMSEGQILFQGQPIQDDLMAYKKRMGYVPEEPYLYSHLSGSEYLTMVAQLRGLPAKQSSERIDGMLRLLSLHDDRRASISGYSKGMRQKILLIAALMHNPELILLDEPFSGLDVGTSLVLRSLIQELAARGKVVLFSSHELDTVERVCSHVVILHRGKVVADDSIERLRSLMELPTLEAIFLSSPSNRILFRSLGRLRISSMLKLIERLAGYLPLDFRVLYRQFLLRVIDLEALSIQADVTRFLGQFAGVLIMISLLSALRAFVSTIAPPTTAAGWLNLEWGTEQSAITVMMLVIGLLTVVSWDSTFPDRKDVMVLSPLPVAPQTILFAKVSASGALVGLAILALNFASGSAWSLILGSRRGGLGFLQLCSAWWLTMIAASAFLYCSVLTVQGFTALLFPRRVFLRLSAILQLAAFGLFLGVYFVPPSLTTPADMAARENHWILASSPSYWFFALFNQLNGSLPSELRWLAGRAWIGLLVAILGAASSLLLCYLHTMKKTVEEPDLVPGAGGFHWTPSFGNSLQTAIALFSIRSLTRSRQHRVAFAFYLAFVVAIALSLLRVDLTANTPRPVTLEIILPTFLMMLFAVAGLRNLFSLPISLTANWVLRTTQLRPTDEYVAATRRSLLLFAVVPVWLLSFALSFRFGPVQHVAVHLAVLALLGWILVELCLIGFYKVPFTCSYLPGKANIQLQFWGLLIALIAFVVPCAEIEQTALRDSIKSALMLGFLFAASCALFCLNRYRARSAVIYFEELPDEVITTLGLSA